MRWVLSLFLLGVATALGAPGPRLLESNLWYQSGTLRIRAMIVRPAKTGRLPAVMLNHGGTSGISESTRARARELATAGYAVFVSAYRGEDGSDGSIEIAKGEVLDVLSGAAWFARQPYVDAARLGMLGTSHGALIGLLAASRIPKLRALIFAYGVADIYAWYQYLVDSNQLGQDALTKALYGKGPTDKPENFLERYGLRAVPDLPSALNLLIVQGAKDTTVPLAQAQTLADNLKQFNKSFRLEVYPNSEHGFLMAREALLKQYGVQSVQYAESLHAWQSVLRFLKLNLQTP